MGVEELFFGDRHEVEKVRQSTVRQSTAEMSKQLAPCLYQEENTPTDESQVANQNKVLEDT